MRHEQRLRNAGPQRWARAATIAAPLLLSPAPGRAQAPPGATGDTAGTTAAEGQEASDELEQRLNDAETKLAAAEASVAQKDALLQAQEAKTEAATLTAQNERLKEEVDKQQKTLEDIRSGKLIEYGITAGFGPVLHMPLHSAKGLRASTPAMSTMPYVMLHPGYWQDQPERNRYCANVWRGETSQDASNAADDIALRRAQSRVDSLFANLQVNPDLSLADLRGVGYGWHKREFQGLSLDDLTAAKAIVKAKAKGEKTVTLRGVTSKVEDLELALAKSIRGTVLGWHPTVRAKCGTRRYLGVWFGVPLKYSSTIPVQVGPDEDAERRRLSVRPIIAGGYGITPNAYISVLFGLSVGKVNLAPGDDDDEFVLAATVGVGGNLDIISLLRSEK